jgi:hypothetical protein
VGWRLRFKQTSNVAYWCTFLIGRDFGFESAKSSKADAYQALPFKLIFFVLVDGWSAVADSFGAKLWVYFGLCGDGLYRHCEPTGRANARPMTGSAKQSIQARRTIRLDCFVALLLAMTKHGHALNRSHHIAC